MAAKRKKAKKAVERKSAKKRRQAPNKSAKGKKFPAVRQFTAKQQRFIDCYAGDIKKAAEKAKISYSYARKLMMAEGTKGNILEAIQDRQETEIRPKNIADRQERQAFWTQMMRDGKEDAKDRLKASELLGKSEADFTENLSHKFPEGCGVMLIGGQMDPNKWRKQSEQHHKHGSNSRNPN